LVEQDGTRNLALPIARCVFWRARRALGAQEQQETGERDIQPGRIEPLPGRALRVEAFAFTV
jgi:hypothetical protein